MIELLIFILTYVFIAAQKVNARLDRASVALIGATAMIVSGVLTLKEAVKSVDYDTIILLFGMMVISAYLGSSGFFDFVAGRIITKARSGKRLLLIITLTSALLSSILVNDVVCIFMTPIVVRIALLSDINPIPLLLALSTSANIGSCATIVGNPQNMLIAMKTHLSFMEFLKTLAPVSAISLVFCYLLLYAIFRSDLERFRPRKIEFSVDRGLMIRTLMVLTITVALFVSEALPIPVSALVGATLAFIFGGRRPREIIKNIDWNLLIFFSALFIVVAGFEKGGWLNYFKFTGLKTLRDYMIFSAVTTILSNLISNVPFVMVALPFVKGKKMAYLLAMSSTFAGNLTLIGSVANIIVAETAESLGVRISFKDYLKIGIPLTLLSVLIGTLMIYYS